MEERGWWSWAGVRMVGTRDLQASQRPLGHRTRRCRRMRITDCNALLRCEWHALLCGWRSVLQVCVLSRSMPCCM